MVLEDRKGTRHVFGRSPFRTLSTLVLRGRASGEGSSTGQPPCTRSASAPDSNFKPLPTRPGSSMPLFAYDPYVRLDLAKNRQSHVPDRLVATGVLTRPDASAAASAPLHLR